ncbi:peptidoglycan-binding protein [Yoonia sp. R2331]|uniref:peptidoglycan-binding domain-containing protein n=1 Tax=Yoonia sp. R2331 TaxID=3237238 RepID=UPI0034E470AC
MRRLFLTTCLSLGFSPAFADDAALILGIERYEQLDRVVQGALATRSGAALEQAGFTVYAGANSDKDALRALAEGFQSEVTNADRLVVSLTGRFANDGTRTWFMASNIAAPKLFKVMDRSIAIETVLHLLAQAPGQAVLLLGEEAGDDDTYDGPLRAGIAPLDIPQGVTVIRGRPGAVAELLEDTVVAPGEDLLRQARRTRGVRIEGFQPAALVMTPQGTPPQEPANTTGAGTNRVLDETAWGEAAAQDSAQGYLAYIARFPKGRHLEEAREKLAEIRAEPNRGARLAEEALELSRQARRAIQRDLNVLDYNTRGIDGIFGPGTRQAITNWQQQNGLSQTGYLNANQIVRLDGQASRRAAELEAAAERQRAAEERRDRAFWEETGARGDEAGFRAYLGRYPDGMFANRANEQLQVIQDAKRQQARAEERAVWDRARNRNTPNAYRTYLEQYPRGSFVGEANDRIRILQQDNNNAADRQQAEAAEQQLGLDPITLRLIEAKLQQLGLEPGAVDGRIDNRTRRAIRRYQRDRELDRTGYLNQATVSRLLRDAFR